MDHIDIQILNELSSNGRIKIKDLSKKIHLTAPATSQRVLKLEDNGIIEKYTIKINQTKLGYTIHAFITVMIKNISHEYYLSFIKKQEEHLINNYKISGEGCYLLECRFSSNQSMSQFLEKLNNYANYKLAIVID